MTQPRGEASESAGTRPRRRPVRNPLTWLLVGGVRAYQLIVSPWFAPTCRYYPSCSTYAIDALRKRGPLAGTGLAVWRVLRCNPWSAGGVDHVPPRRSQMDHGHPHRSPDRRARTLVAGPASMGPQPRA
ncbi:membrane protein insertion efficiency factor YidD [Occultella glacieicola]|uniref:Putative membrane protein insertion efficiency factor n=1 Tax=Occultella glacieicola TaxID=2518684 RepID=A0ABY2E8B9_9MICO|nr:membrane protein insertion efficiency factor YidD [Occultella glacieicola]TDE98749.1 membrane protein insertion efficiency factor YidD [Occultella glacieicola]